MSNAQKDIKELQEQLQYFEKQYHLSSEEFYRRFHHGELGDKGDYFEWSACYDMYQAAHHRLHDLARDERDKFWISLNLLHS